MEAVLAMFKCMGEYFMVYIFNGCKVEWMLYFMLITNLELVDSS